MRSNRRQNRRRTRNYRKKTGVNFGHIIVIIVLAVVFGYLTTNFIIQPILTTGNQLQTEGETGTQTPGEENALQEEPTQSDVGIVLEDAITVEQTASGYAIQYGSFSTQEAAAVLLKELEATGIKAQIIERDGQYKVTGTLFGTKNEAVTSLQQLDKTKYRDVFVTMF